MWFLFVFTQSGEKADRMKWEGGPWERIPEWRGYQPRLSQFRSGAGGYLKLNNLPQLVFSTVNSYLVSLESPWILGFFNCAAVALLSHKIMKIALHGPLPVWGVVLAFPSLFAFDFLTLTVLHWGLNSARIIFRILAGMGIVALILLSSVFA